MSVLSSRNEWIFGKTKDVINDKKAMLDLAVSQMLNKTLKIFKYNNLPDTITDKDIEIYNQVGGFSIWTLVDGKLYVFQGGLGGEPNQYYLPTKAIVANPYLRFNETLDIDVNCVVMLNDYLYQGFMPLFNKYGSMLVEAELSLKNAIINARVPALVQADNDNTYKSAVEFFKKIVSGEEYGIISSKEFFDGIKTHDFYKQAYIKDLIESIQYIKGSWYNEIGLNAQFNMKRESINEAEAAMNEDILYPTIDTMLQCRKNAVDKINSMFGTDISVELESVWKQNDIQENLAIEKQIAEIESIDNETEVEDENNRDIDNPTEN